MINRLENFDEWLTTDYLANNEYMPNKYETDRKEILSKFCWLAYLGAPEFIESTLEANDSLIKREGALLREQKVTEAVA